MGAALVLFLVLVNIVCIVLFVRAQRAFERKRIEIAIDPPFMKCPTCGLTVLGNDPVSQQVHVLCIIKTHEQIEADKAKAIEAPKADGKYKIKIQQTTSKVRPSNFIDWAFDDDARTWYRFFWTVKTADGYLVDSGHDKDHGGAEWAAEAVAERHREGNREYEF